MMKHRLSMKLLFYIVLCSSFFTLLVTAFQLYMDYRRDLAAVHESIQFIESSYLRAIAASAWDMDEKQLTLLLQGALKLQDVEYLEIIEPRTAGEVIIAAQGNPNSKKDIVREFSLEYTNGPKGTLRTAKLRVTASLEGVYQRIFSKALIILASNAIKMFLASFFIFLIIQFLITRHITKMARYTQKLEPDKLDKGLVLDRKTDKSSAPDELDELVTSFNNMRVRLNKDIEDRKQAEEALRESEEKYRLLVENANDAIYIAQDDVVKFPNTRTEELTGYSAEELKKIPFGNHIHPDDRKMVMERHKRRLEGEDLVSSYSYRAINRTGEELWHLLNTVLITWEGRPATLNFTRDITEAKRLEAQLEKANKMEAIATLAGGVAHEFNNALMGVMGNIELLKMDLPEDERRDRYFEAMKDSSHRMSRLTDQLLAYAQGGKYQPKDLKLDDFVIQTLPILQHDLDPAVRVETHFEKDIAHIRADNAQMQMVLSAILANSNEAIEEEGLIRITAENKDIDGSSTKEYPGLKPGPYVCLTIEDDGKGMDEETRNGIFEPFFTTKFQGRGMGMAAVYGIVKNHNGWIYVESELEKGTVVRIYLPAIEIEVTKQEKAEVEVVRGSGTILMIEDEDVVIEVTQAMLEWLGYRVMIAKTGKDAIHITETFDGRIDLALLDIKLPDMEGGKVYPLIMEARPDLKVIVFSGYAIDGPARKILDAGAQDFIQKPFSLATLSEKLKEVLVNESYP